MNNKTYLSDIINTLSINELWEIIHSPDVLSHIITSVDNSRVYVDTYIKWHDKYYQIAWSSIHNDKNTFHYYTTSEVRKIITGEFVEI